MATVVRIPITNVFAKGDYTGVIVVGPDKRPMNVLLDTGSSAPALDGTKYTPDFDGGDQSTKLAQTAAFGDGSGFTGAVIKSSVTVGTGNATATLKGGNVAVAYDATENMFGDTDGILGLQGDAGDVKLDVQPSSYWQANTQQAGFATPAITPGQPGLAILGLPLMNGYFTIFDGEADGGKGVVKFAKAKV